MSDEGKRKRDDDGPGARLDRPLQEHLGRQLRAAYNELEEKPAYLGDTALPLEFEDRLRRMNRANTAHEEGIAAVSNALKSPPEPSIPKPEAAAEEKKNSVD